MDVEGWLRGLGLERYAEIFRTNDIGPDVVPDMTDADLAALGVSLGDRRRLLRAIAGLPEAVPSQATRAEAERRQLTVMFVDLVGSTALSAGLDPEDMREVLRDYVDAAATAIGRFDGHVARFLGDGVLAYFGYPRAHEDDAERAVRAGLDALDAVGRLRTPHGVPLAARVGIATGLVVVGDLIGQGATQEQAVVGDTPNLAARLQALAEPGTLVVAAPTRRLLGELFELADLGPVEAKGFAGPLKAFRVVGEGRAHGRFEALRGTAATTLIGREPELQTLMERWQLARAGEGQTVLLAGEPGIGKSRLLQVVCERVAGEPHTRLRYFCSPFHRSTAFHPILEQIERAAGIGRHDPPKVEVDKLKVLFGSAADTATLTAALLGIPPEPGGSASTLSPQARKSKLQRLWLDQLARLAERRAVLMLLEDAHWIDPSSLELFDQVVDCIQQMPVLLVVTARPEFRPPWEDHAHVTALTLDRLDRHQSATLIEHVAAGKALPKGIAQQIVAKADGVPLFLEELAKIVLESGAMEDTGDHPWRPTPPLPTLAIPATLHDSLLARLDRLAPVKEVAQAAAAIGREFTRDLLSAACHLDERELDEALGQLAAADLIRGVAAQGDTSYAFKHALVQDAAYATLLRARRQLIHRRIAAALRSRLAECAPELVAHHLTEAGEADQSVGFWARAGRLAVARAASREAVAHYTRAIAQLLSLPDTMERKRREAALQDALGGALAHIAGVDSEPLVQVYARARDLCRQTGYVEGEFVAEWNLWHILIARYEHGEAQALSEHLMAMAERESDPGLLLQALHVEWSTLSYKGLPRATIASCERGWALYDSEQHAAHFLTFGARDPGVCSRIVCAFEVWCLGQPEQALRCYEDGLALARRLGQPLVLLHALAKGLPLFQLLRDHERLASQALDALQLATEQDSANFRIEARFMHAWLLSDRGEPERAVQLGSVDILPQQNAGSDEVDEGEIAACQLLEAGEYTPVVLHEAEQDLDLVALLVELPVGRSLVDAGGFGRDHRKGSTGRDRL